MVPCSHEAESTIRILALLLGEADRDAPSTVTRRILIRSNSRLGSCPSEVVRTGKVGFRLRLYLCDFDGRFLLLGMRPIWLPLGLCFLLVSWSGWPGQRCPLAGDTSKLPAGATGCGTAENVDASLLSARTSGNEQGGH